MGVTQSWLLDNIYQPQIKNLRQAKVLKWEIPNELIMD